MPASHNHNRALTQLVNVSAHTSRELVVQGGGYGEHRLLSVSTDGGPAVAIPADAGLGAAAFSVALAPGCGATLRIQMERYANRPSVAFPWDRPRVEAARERAAKL